MKILVYWGSKRMMNSNVSFLYDVVFKQGKLGDPSEAELIIVN